MILAALFSLSDIIKHSGRFPGKLQEDITCCQTPSVNWDWLTRGRRIKRKERILDHDSMEKGKDRKTYLRRRKKKKKVEKCSE